MVTGAGGGEDRNGDCWVEETEMVTGAGGGEDRNGDCWVEETERVTVGWRRQKG